MDEEGDDVSYKLNSTCTSRLLLHYTSILVSPALDLIHMALPHCQCLCRLYFAFHYFLYCCHSSLQCGFCLCPSIMSSFYFGDFRSGRRHRSIYLQLPSCWRSRAGNLYTDDVEHSTDGMMQALSQTMEQLWSTGCNIASHDTRQGFKERWKDQVRATLLM